MRIDFSQPIITIKGQPITIDGNSAEPAPLADVCIYALSQGRADEGSQDKYRRYKLARAIEAGGEIDLKAEDIAYLKDCCGRVLPPFAYGAIADLLDPPAA